MLSIVISYFIPAIHVLACLFLIAVVLLQTGKGADMGAVFGGGSQTVLGTGAGNFLTKLTTGTAIAFMLTSLILTYGASRTNTARLLEKLPAVTEQAPAAAAAPGADAPAAQDTAPANTETPPAADGGTEPATPPAN